MTPKVDFSDKSTSFILSKIGRFYQITPEQHQDEYTINFAGSGCR